MVRMVGGRGKNGEVILTGTELFHFPTVWEGLGIQLGVAEHWLEFGIVEGALDGGMGKSLRRGWRLGQWGEGGRGQGVEEGGHLVGQGWEGGFLQGGVVLGPWGPWCEQWVVGMSPYVTGQVGRIGGGGYPSGLLLRWQP